MNTEQKRDSGIHRHEPIVHMSLSVPNLNLLGHTVPETGVTEIFNVWKLEREINGEIKHQIRSSIMISVYMIHPSTIHVCTKFQDSRLFTVSYWIKCDKNFIWSLKIGEREREREIWRNKGKNKQQHHDFGIHNTSIQSQREPSFNSLEFTITEKSVMKIVIWSENGEIKVQISSIMILAYTQ